MPDQNDASFAGPPQGSDRDGTELGSDGGSASDDSTSGPTQGGSGDDPSLQQLAALETALGRETLVTEAGGTESGDGQTQPLSGGSGPSDPSRSDNDQSDTTLPLSPESGDATAGLRAFGSGPGPGSGTTTAPTGDAETPGSGSAIEPVTSSVTNPLLMSPGGSPGGQSSGGQPPGGRPSSWAAMPTT